MLCPIVIGPHSKIPCLNVAFFLGRKASENFDFYPKSAKQIFLNLLAIGGGGGDTFLDFVKLKKEINKKYYALVQIKNI